MNAETLKRLEELNDKWANPHDDTSPNVTACEVMDHLPDLIAAVKERDGAVESVHRSSKDIVALEEKLLHIAAERDAAQKACAEMRNIFNAMPYHDPYEPIMKEMIAHALSTDCGKGYHADSEWGIVVEALRQVDQCGMEHFKFSSCACAGGIKQALAHAAKLMEGT